MGRQLFGRATIAVNGRTLETHTGATLNPGGIARETVTMANSAGYTEKYAPSKVECEIAFGVGDKLSDFDFADVSVQFQCDTGQTYVIASAWRTDPPDLSEGGKNKLILEGEPAKELL